VEESKTCRSLKSTLSLGFSIFLDFKNSKLYHHNAFSPKNTKTFPHRRWWGCSL